MDRRTVLTKTAKGLMEVTGKTSLLSRDQRSLLAHVDGKATVGDLQQKVGKMTESKLQMALTKLVSDGFVREFVFAPHSVSPPSQLFTRHDLDFSEFIPQDKAREAALQAAEAVEIARTMHAKENNQTPHATGAAAPQPKPDPVRDAVTRAKRQAEEGARREAEAQARREAEEKARRALADKAHREAEAKRATEAKAKAKREAEEKARREADAEVRREIEAKVKREAEEKAKREAETKVKREAEEKARREAEAKAKREAEAKAQREAEEKARREAEAKAKREAEEQARREAAAQAQREADAKAKREAEEKARREAEAKAKREAEAQARREAEAQAKREADEKARREADAKAKREAEEQARLEAAAKVKREAEAKARREAEAKAKREAEEQARREAKAQAKRDAEEKARLQAEAKAKRDAEEKARREAEVKRKAEEKARREAEARERQEAKARAAAQAVEIAQLEADAQAQRHAADRAEKARRNWEERAEQERVQNMRRAEEGQHAREAEKEAKRRQLEEERTRARADAERAASVRREQRAREKAEADTRASARKREREREFAAVASRLRRIRSGKPGRVRNALLGGVALVVVAGVLLAPFWPVNPMPYERMARDALGVPVTIAKASYSWTPWPAMEFTQVAIGGDGEVKIGKALAVPTLWTLLSDAPELRQLELSEVVLKPAALAAVLTTKFDASIPALRQIGLSQVRLDAPGVTLPVLHGQIDLRGGRSPGTVRLVNDPATLSLQVVPHGGGTGSFELQLADGREMIGIPLVDVAAKGRLTVTQAEVTSFDGRLYDGVMKGQGVLNWSPLSFEGSLEVTSLTTAKITPVLDGRLSAKGGFSMRAGTFDDLFSKPTVDGRFDVTQGAVHGLDMPRSLQAGEVAVGVTPFDELSGRLRLENGHLRLSGLRMRAGVMAASGSAELAAGKQLDGNIAAQLRIPAGHVRANFDIGGTPQALTVKR